MEFFLLYGNGFEQKSFALQLFQLCSDARVFLSLWIKGGEVPIGKVQVTDRRDLGAVPHTMECFDSSSCKLRPQAGDEFPSRASDPCQFVLTGPTIERKIHSAQSAPFLFSPRSLRVVG